MSVRTVERLKWWVHNAIEDAVDEQDADVLPVFDALCGLLCPETNAREQHAIEQVEAIIEREAAVIDRQKGVGGAPPGGAPPDL